MTNNNYSTKKPGRLAVKASALVLALAGATGLTGCGDPEKTSEAFDGAIQTSPVTIYHKYISDTLDEVAPNNPEYNPNYKQTEFLYEVSPKK